MAGLEKAHRIRSTRAEMRKGIMAGAIDPVPLVAGRDEVWEPHVKEMRLGHVLACIRGFGPVTVRTTLEALSLPAEVRLWELTFERREEVSATVAAMLGDHLAPMPDLPNA